MELDCFLTKGGEPRLILICCASLYMRVYKSTYAIFYSRWNSVLDSGGEYDRSTIIDKGPSLCHEA
jgi:hypothetical protein